MGIVNVTPDSFSDAGECFAPEDAVRRAFEHVRNGAAIIDVGGESTRPGATDVAWRDEWLRVAPVLEGIRGIGCRVSVDTRHPETAERALEAGADIINCVDPEAVPRMLAIAAAAGEKTELVVPSVCLEACAASQMARRVYLDPMIGFGTTREEDLGLLRSIPDLAGKGRVLVGASRKRIAAVLSGGSVSTAPTDIAVALWCAAHGAAAVRVHDVKQVTQALRAWEILSRKEK